MTATYLLDNRESEAADRFAALSTLFDAGTARHVDALGVGPGDRCWEVGAGGPRVPRLLAARVGAAGAVLATDIDVRHLAGLCAPVAVRRHDVAADRPPAERFDLVHCRLVLSHVPAREEALRRMTSALSPGGWLLVEDFDVALGPLACPAVGGAAAERANRIRAGFLALLRRRGVAVALGRALPGLLRGLGLVDVSSTLDCCQM